MINSIKIRKIFVLVNMTAVLLCGCSADEVAEVSYDGMLGAYNISIPVLENTVSFTDMGESGFLTEYYDFEYDSNGNCISKKVKSSDDTSYTYCMEYDDGYMVKTTIYDELAEVYAVYEYEYDDHGNVVASIFDFDGSIDSYIYEYSYEGDLVVGLTTYYEYDWSLSYITQNANYSYDNMNNILGYTVSDSRTGTLEAVEFVYDGAGRKLLEKNAASEYAYAYDANGMLNSIKSDGATQTYIYEVSRYDNVNSEDLEEIKSASVWKNIANTYIPDPESCIVGINKVSDSQKKYVYQLPKDKSLECFYIYQGVIGAIEGCSVLVVNDSVYAMKDGIAEVKMTVGADGDYGYILTLEVLSGRNKKSSETLIKERNESIEKMKKKIEAGN